MHINMSTHTDMGSVSGKLWIKKDFNPSKKDFCTSRSLFYANVLHEL